MEQWRKRICGRFTLGVSATTLAAQFNLADLPAWAPRYNIASTQEVLNIVIIPNHPRRQAHLHRWRLVPPWADDPRISNRLIKARAETVVTKPAFRRASRGRRGVMGKGGLEAREFLGGETTRLSESRT